MTTAADFLPAILADPDDDTPRLVLADWLEESGTDPLRAEFIRVQVKLATVEARLGTADEMFRDKGDRDAFRHREWELLWATSHLRHPLCGERPNLFFWSGPALELIPNGAKYTDHLTFRRGFVERVTCTADDWEEHGDTIARAQPVREVELTTWPRESDEGCHGAAASQFLHEFRQRWSSITFTLTDDALTRIAHAQARRLAEASARGGT
ncbi:MAG: TIGR02996 domain-containing protein [Pseudomonadota bacterium]